MAENKQFDDYSPNPTDQFISAIASVDNFNSRFTGLGGAMLGFLSMVVRTEEQKPETPSRADEERMERDLVHMLQTDELDAMGIKLFDAEAPGVREFTGVGDGSRVSPSSLILLLDDEEKFGAEIAKLDSTDEQKSAVDKALGSVLSNSASLVSEAYMMPEEEGGKNQDAIYIADRQLDMFMALNPLLIEKDFGSVWAVERLSEFAVRREAGTLKDFLVASKLGLMAGPDSFGPSAWQGDASRKYLATKWQGGLDFLKTLREKQSPFYTELFNKLRYEFDVARDDANGRDQTGWTYRWHSKVLENINAQWEQDFTLENSFYLTERKDEGYNPMPLPVVDKEPMPPEWLAKNPNWNSEDPFSDQY